ncbi:hypothetical protein KHP62_21605, partial [Rhodobacteraceae bacterium NNCM2]|nr:hypothetical protein [Coraliihabitans acroporae]
PNMQQMKISTTPSPQDPFRDSQFLSLNQAQPQYATNENLHHSIPTRSFPRFPISIPQLLV